MNTAIEVKNETAQKLLSLAKTAGLSVDQLLYLHIPALAERPKELSPTEKAKAIQQWVDGHRRDIPSLSDEAVSRESFYK